MKCGDLGIRDPRLSAELAHKTYKSANEVLVGSLLGGININCVAHKGFIHRVSADGWKQKNFSEKVALIRWKELVYESGLNRLWRAMENGAWLMAIPY